MDQIKMPKSPWEMTPEELDQALIQKDISRKEEAKAGEERWKNRLETFKKEAPETLQDMAVSAGQSATLELGDEAYGTMAAAYKKLTGDPRPYETLYSDFRDTWRDVVDGARSRSPISTFIADAAGYVVPTKAVGKIIKNIPRMERFIPAGSIRKTIAEMATVGAGKAETLKEVPSEAAQHATIGGVLHGATSVAKVPFSKWGEKRATVLGAGGKEFQARGFRRNIATGEYIPTKHSAIEESVKVSSELGTYKGGGRSFDVDKMKFVPDRSGVRIKNENSSLEGYSKRIEEALYKLKNKTNKIIDQISDQKNSYFDKSNISTPREKMEDNIGDLYDLANRQVKINPKLEGIWKEEMDILESKLSNTQGEAFSFSDGGPPKFPHGSTLSDIQAIKREYQDLASRAYKNLNSSIGDIDRADIQKEIASSLREFIEKEAGDLAPELIKSNEISSKLLDIKNAIDRKASYMKTGTGRMRIPGLTNVTYESGQLLKGIPKSVSGGMAITEVGRYADKIPKSVRDALENMSIKAGVEDIKDPNGVAPKAIKGVSETLKWGAKNYFGPTNYSRREPQSIGAPVYDDNFLQQTDDIAEQLMLSRMPRTTQGILENANVFLLKVAQQMPMMYDNVKYVLEKQPEQIQEILPALVHGMPQHFETDKYERVDNIVPPPLRRMAEKDLWDRNDLSLAEKTILNDQLNRTGKFELPAKGKE